MGWGCGMEAAVTVAGRDALFRRPHDGGVVGACGVGVAEHTAVAHRHADRAGIASAFDREGRRAVCGALDGEYVHLSARDFNDIGV